MHVVVCGAGAIGATYAARLHDLDPASVAVLAGGERAGRYRRAGFTVNGRPYAFRVLDTGEPGAPADVVLVAVKHHHLGQAIADLRGHVGPDTVLVSLLNGISSEEVLGRVFGPERVLHAFVVGTDAVREGTETRYASMGRIVFGATSNDPADPRVARVRGLLERAGIPCLVPADILREQWWKFMLNVGVNQVSAVLRAPYGAFALPEVGDLARAAMREVVALAGREGVALSEADVERCFPIVAGLAPGGKTSMLQDVEAGRKTEVEIFAGTVVELGRRHGLATPVNELLGRLITAQERMAGVG